ncbi:alpha/beta fold hydrolase [Nocardia pseudovaccinii]|uniref:alpha/beta fold hydrolase n=1 Tax=Nocardia pseudovaccinii TaxID=189540 RepID=UPI003D90FD6A
MQTAYKSARGQRAVQRWCAQAISRANFPLTTTAIDTSVGRIQLTSAGTGTPRIVVVPGTGFNAAVALPWLQAFSAHWPSVIVDLPGQPGLSDPRRPRRARLPWYGQVLDEILTVAQLDDVVLVGNSLGAAVALAADSARITARALISPAGYIRLTVNPKVAVASAIWMLHPSTEHTRDMLRWFVAPGEEPPETEVEWMTLMATSCRTTLAPPPLPADVLADRADSPCVVAVGEHDRFLPPRRLAPAVQRTMNVDPHIIAGMGHLTTPAHLDEVVTLVAEVAPRPGGA